MHTVSIVNCCDKESSLCEVGFLDYLLSFPTCDISEEPSVNMKSHCDYDGILIRGKILVNFKQTFSFQCEN